MPATREIEWRLRTATPLRVAAVDAALRQLGCPFALDTSKRLLDTYFDDARGSLWAAGVGLRQREGPGGREITGKRRASAAAGLFVREEVTLPWPSGCVAHAACDLPPALRDRIEPYVLARPLVAHLQLAIGRELRSLTLATGTKARLTIDRVQLLAGDRRLEFGELEVEVDHAADADAIAPLIRQLADLLHAAPAADDKPTHAARLLGKLETAAVPAHGAAMAWQPPRDIPSAGELHPQSLLQRHLASAQHAEVEFRCDRTADRAHRLREAVGQLHAGVAVLTETGCFDALTATQTALVEAMAPLEQLDHHDACLELWPKDTSWPTALRTSAAALRHDWHARRDHCSAAVMRWLSDGTRLSAWQTLHDACAVLQADPGTAGNFAAAMQRLIDHTAASLRQRLRDASLVDEPDALGTLTAQCERLHHLLAVRGAHDEATAATELRQELRERLAAASRLDAAQQLLASALSDATAAPMPPLQTAAAGHLLGVLHRAARKARKRLGKKLPELRRRRAWRDLLESDPEEGNMGGPDDATLA